MPLFDWLDPERTGIQTATAAGSFVALMTARRRGWIFALLLFAVGQLTSFYWTLPLAHAFQLPMSYYGAIGFTIGALAMLLWGAIIALAVALWDDPRAMLSWAAGLLGRRSRHDD